MKTAEIFSKAVGLDITSEDCHEVLLLRSTVEIGLKAVEKALQWDYSKSCECKESTGETWCCNICGLPTSKHYGEPIDNSNTKIEDVIPNPDKDLIREVIMRHGLAFPETEQDLKWSEQKPDHELMVKLFEYLELGGINI